MNQEKSNYEIYREKVAESAKSYPNPPKEVDQTILWIKAIATEKIELSEAYGEDKGVFTFRDGERFGFSEKYLNLLLHYAYERGKAVREDDFKRQTADMTKALDDIKDALENVGWIDYSE